MSNPKGKAYYYCYDMPPEKEISLREAMRKLSRLLNLAPAEIDYRFSELPEEHTKNVRDIINGIDIVGAWSVRIARYFRRREGNPSGILILCARESRLAKLSKDESSSACWGYSYPWLGLSYGGHDEYIVWHEMMHLLGADDCYDLKQRSHAPNCELDNCIMQYEPTKHTVGEWPFLCCKNINLIKKRLGA